MFPIYTTGLKIPARSSKRFKVVYENRSEPYTTTADANRSSPNGALIGIILKQER